MREHLKSFLSYLKLNRHVSPHTLRAYESDVSQYLAWVSSETGRKMSQLAPDDLSMDSVRGHVAELNKAGKARTSPGSRSAGVSSLILRSFSPARNARNWVMSAS